MEDQIIKWLLGELSDEEGIRVRDEIDNKPALKKLLVEYRKIFQDFEKIPLSQPSEESKLKFRQWLEIQQTNSQKKSIIAMLPAWIKYGVAASIFLAVGWLIGKQFNGYNGDRFPVVYTDSKNELLQLISTETTSQRIKGINRTYDLPDLDPDVQDALIKVLYEDKSSNVRLAAVEALSYFSHEEEIKFLLIDQLKIQVDPIVQIAIINALVELDDPEATSTFEKMLDEKELPKSVQDELAHGMIKIL